MMIDIFLYLFLGAIAGLLSGLLGVGGGIIIVPGLTFIFLLKQFPSNYLMHIAIATSFIIILTTVSRALILRIREGLYGESLSLFKRWWPSIFIGTLLGSSLSYILNTKWLSLAFSIFLIFVASRLLYGYTPEPSKKLPKTSFLNLIGCLIGAKSGLLGIGGGAITIPFLIYCNFSIREAGVVSLAISLITSLTATINLLFLAHYQPIGMSWMTGFIYWPAWFFVSLATTFFVPLGIKLSHKISTSLLKKIFGGVLFLVAIALFLKVY